jgi:hypothetical protein
LTISRLFPCTFQPLLGTDVVKPLPSVLFRQALIILDQYISETLPQIKEFLATLRKPEYAPFELLNSLLQQALEEFKAKPL